MVIADVVAVGLVLPVILPAHSVRLHVILPVPVDMIAPLLHGGRQLLEGDRHDVSRPP